MSWTTFSFSLASAFVCELNKFPDSPGLFLLLKEESSAGIWKLPKDLSDLGGGGWKGSKNYPDGGGGGINGSEGGKPGPWSGPGGSAGGDSGGERSSVGSCLSFNLFNWFLREKWIPGGSGAWFIRSLANFFPPNIKFSK